MKKLLAALLISGLLFSTGTASAQNFSTPLQAGSTSTTSLNGNNSYACFVSGIGSYELSLTVTGPASETITAIYPAVEQKTLESLLLPALNFGDAALGNNLITFNTTKGPAGTGNYTVTLQSVGGGSDNPYILCTPTAVVCGFNTYNSDAVYLELINTGGKPVSASFFTLDYAGNTVDSGVELPVGIRRDIDVHSMVGASKYGSVVIRPQIAPVFFGESIRARVSHYSGGVLQNTEVCTPATSLFLGV